MEALELPVRRRTSRVAAFIALGLSAGGAVLFGIAALATRARTPAAVAIFLALLAALFTVSAVFNSRPTRPWVISDDGLVISIGTISQRFAWSSLMSFRVGPTVRKVDTISVDFAPGYKPRGRQRFTTLLTRAVAHADLNVGNLTQVETSKLVELLNERRRRATDG
jgi:hypothetical protein